MLAIIPIRFRYIVDCIHSKIFVWKKFNSENITRMCGRPFPPDLNLNLGGVERFSEQQVIKLEEVKVAGWARDA